MKGLVMTQGNPSRPIGKTGSATIKRQGHTATDKFGSNPDAQVKGAQTPRDLNAK